MAANVNEVQTNIENETIEKHNEKLTCLLMILYDGKNVSNFNNTWGVC